MFVDIKVNGEDKRERSMQKFISTVLSAIEKYRMLLESVTWDPILVWWVWEGFPSEVTKWIYKYLLSEYVSGLTFMAHNPNFNMQKFREIRSGYFTEREIV